MGAARLAAWHAQHAVSPWPRYCESHTHSGCLSVSSAPVLRRRHLEWVSPVGAVLGLDPAAPAGQVVAAAFLGDDALQAELAERSWASSTSIRRPRLGLRAVVGVPSMAGASRRAPRRRVRRTRPASPRSAACRGASGRRGGGSWAGRHRRTRPARHRPRDHPVAGEFGDEAGHVPATATVDAQVAVPRDERAEAVPLWFEGVVVARR